MKKVLILLTVFFMGVASSAFSANVTIGDLTADASPTTDDLIETENDPGGTPGARKVTLGALATLVSANIAVDSVGTTELNDGSDIPSTGECLKVGSNTAQVEYSSCGVGSGIANVVDDTTPQLGGNLDVNGQSIVSVSNGNIVLNPDGTGTIRFPDLTNCDTIDTDADGDLICGTDSGGGTGGTTDGGTTTYVTGLTDDFAIGGTDSTAPIHFDESAGAAKIEGGITVGDGTDTSLTFMTVDRASTDATFAWDETNDEFDISHPLNISGTSGSLVLNNQNEIRFEELTANGSNYTSFKAAAAMAANVLYTLPNADGTSGQVLSTNGSGALSWTTASGGGGGDNITEGDTVVEVVDTGSDGTIKLSTDGTVHAYMDNAGDVAIGVSTGGLAPLHVAGTSESQGASADKGIFKVSGDGDMTKRLAITFNTSTNVGGIDVADEGVGWGTLSLQAASGDAKVGVGIEAPTAKFEVKGKTSTSAAHAFRATDNVSTPILDVRNDGRVGVGTTAPAHALDVVGTAGLSTGTAWTNTSDKRIKQDIQSIESGLSVIQKLNPVSFKYTDDYKEVHPTVKDHSYFGFIAQEFESVFPHYVNVDSEKTYGSVENLKQINVSAVQPYLVKAVQELAKKMSLLFFLLFLNFCLISFLFFKGSK